MSSSAAAPAAAAAASAGVNSRTPVGHQGSAIPTIPAGAAIGGKTVASPSEVLAEAARRIEAETPWYETLGLVSGEVGDGGGDVAVEAVIAVNIVSGLIDAANETILAPAFVAVKRLLGAMQGAAAAREEIVQLIRYCVGISRCLLEAARVADMPDAIKVTIGEFKGEIEAVEAFIQTYVTRSAGCCRKKAFNTHDRSTAEWHRQKLKGLLDAVLAGLTFQIYAGVNEVRDMVVARDSPPLEELAEVPREAPKLPPSYVPRTAILKEVVQDLVDPQRSASATHCLLGMGGGGKTLMASSVVHDDGVRASFKDGIFWVPVAREGNDVAILLEHLAAKLAKARSITPQNCSRRFKGTEEAARHLSAVLEKSELRCLVVLDQVWSVEVVNAFASTGLHILVTTRQRTVISPAHSGLCTEVGNMSEEDALEVLRKASEACDPLPDGAAQVAHYCSMLPLALGMVGTLAKDQPLDPASWYSLHEKLREASDSFEQTDDGALFSSILTSFDFLPPAQQDQLRLMAVMPSGVVATSEMLANLWDQDISDVPTGARVLVDRCLLQDMLDGFLLHDLVLEYLQLTIGMDGGALAEKASSRQARYLGRLGVFNMYDARGTYASTGGLQSLIALWNSVKKLDGTVDVGACYTESLRGVTDINTRRRIGWLLILLGKYDDADALYQKSIEIEEKALGPDHPGLAASIGNRAVLLEAQGKYDEADPLYLRAIAITEKALGPDHPSLAESLNNRAELLTAQGRTGEARLVFEKALAILRKALGEGHENTKYVYNQIKILGETQVEGSE